MTGFLGWGAYCFEATNSKFEWLKKHHLSFYGSGIHEDLDAASGSGALFWGSPKPLSGSVEIQRTVREYCSWPWVITTHLKAKSAGGEASSSFWDSYPLSHTAWATLFLWRPSASSSHSFFRSNSLNSVSTANPYRFPVREGEYPGVSLEVALPTFVLAFLGSLLSARAVRHTPNPFRGSYLPECTQTHYLWLLRV